jgi:hypothetical protein
MRGSRLPEIWASLLPFAKTQICIWVIAEGEPALDGFGDAAGEFQVAIVPFLHDGVGMGFLEMRWKNGSRVDPRSHFLLDGA